MILYHVSGRNADDAWYVFPRTVRLRTDLVREGFTLRGLTRALLLPFGFATIAAACAKSEGQMFAASGSSGDNGGESSGSASGGLFVGGAGNGNGNLSLGSSGGSGLPSVAGGQISAAGGPNITVNGQPKSVQLTATANGSPVSGTWTTSNSEIGAVDSSGVFQANGYVGGTVGVSLMIGMRAISITLTVDVDITDNPAMASASDQTALQAGGAADPAFKFLYPYDGTVFPRGLQTPLLQFGDGMTVSGGAADVVYLKLTTTHFSYQQYAAGGTPVRKARPSK